MSSVICNTKKRRSLKFSSELLIKCALLLIIYMDVVRAYLIDSIVILVFSVLIIIFTSLLHVSKFGYFPLAKDKSIFLLLIFFPALLFSANYSGEFIFKDLFLFFVNPMLYFSFYILLRNKDIVKFIYSLFLLIFLLESAFILIEGLDFLLGFDIHRIGLIEWYIKSDAGRFEHIYLSGNTGEIFQFLPTALGLHGFPHYTAPLYTVSFIILAAALFSKSSRFYPRSNVIQILFLSLGFLCIYLLGVKTHFVTSIISIFIIGVFVNKKILAYFGVIFTLLFSFTVMSDWGMVRYENYKEQIFEGGYRYEGNEKVEEPGRLEVIFNFNEYLIFLDINPVDLLSGVADFNSINTYEGYLFEQKILVYALVLGLPYVLIILGLIIMGISDCIRIYIKSNDLEIKSFSVALGSAVLILLLEMGHFGFTFNYPNFQILFLLLAVISIIRVKNRRCRGKQ